MGLAMRPQFKRRGRRHYMRMKRWWARRPALRRHAPLVLSLGLNGFLMLAILLVHQPLAPRGVPDAPIDAVNVIVVSSLPQTRSELETPEELSEEQAIDEIGSEAEATAPETETEEAPEDQGAPPEVPSAAPARPATAAVDVPDTDQRRGTPDGVVAIDCYSQFEDRVLAEECAGAEITSDWRARVRNLDDEQWLRAAERLRRGNNRAPMIGPDRYGDLESNQELYEREDPRFAVPFNGSKRYMKSFETEQEYREFLSLNDERSYVGDGGPRPMSGWRPSWQLRDDPNIRSNREMDAFLKSLEETSGASETDQ